MMLYESFEILGLSWAKIYFIENRGMAFGLEFRTSFGKLILTGLRLIACPLGVLYLIYLIRNKSDAFFVTCIALIVAGALGNLIDSVFYGILFTDSYDKVAQFLPADGSHYASLLHGQVVDMFYFPLWEGELFGRKVSFFDYIFNIADSSISIGAMMLIVYQLLFAPKTN